MQVLVIGSGGREHALSWKAAQDSSVENVYVCPGNAGTALEEKVQNIEIDINDFAAIENFCVAKKIGLVIIGPEQPLVDGLSDCLQSKGIKTFGPSQAAAQLEGSKTFSKDFFIKYGIPTAGYSSFDDFETARAHLEGIDYPTVVKADGLAAGKGVIICGNEEEASEALKNIFQDQAFGDAGNRVVIEDFLQGEEASFIAVVSKDKIIPARMHQKILDEVMEPTMRGLINEGSPYLGFLYAGVMIHNGELKVLEFNCRFGDPETQPILLRLKSSLVELCLCAIDDKLELYESQWDERHSCGVVIASEGYPEKYLSNQEVEIKELNSDTMKLFHAGTALENNKVMTSGGRVFCATALGTNLKDAQTAAYTLVQSVSFNGAFCRTDIGYKGIK